MTIDLTDSKVSTGDLNTKISAQAALLVAKGIQVIVMYDPWRCLRRCEHMNAPLMLHGSVEAMRARERATNRQASVNEISQRRHHGKRVMRCESAATEALVVRST